jgi:uncharacterized SAM-binding protein YcdF (DUF218 family)
MRDYLANKTCIDTLILVSSPAHMRRASMIFKTALKDAEIPVYIRCSPSTYSDFDASHWWRRKEDIQTVLGELVKMASFVVFERRGLNKRTFEQTN